jgi:hypothetical protein
LSGLVSSETEKKIIQRRKRKKTRNKGGAASLMPTRPMAGTPKRRRNPQAHKTPRTPHHRHGRYFDQLFPLSHSPISSPTRLVFQIIPLAFNSRTATTTPATTAASVSQNAQHIQARWRCFFFWLASHESLDDASAVMVVQKRNWLRGRPASALNDNDDALTWRVKPLMRRDARLACGGLRGCRGVDGDDGCEGNE